MRSTTTPVPLLDDHANSAVEVLVAFLTVLPFLVLAAVFRDLPDPIPIHWNIRGQVDGYAAKSVFAVFAVPAIGLYMQGLFLMIKRGLVDVRVSLPRTSADGWLEIKRAQLRANVALMDWIRVTDAVLLAAVAWSIVASGLERFRDTATIAVSVAGVAGGLLAIGVLYWVVRLVALKRQIGALPEPEHVPPDPANYRGGGLFYYNPDDPSLFVEKRFGVGYTFNMAHTRVWWYVAYIIGLPVLVGVLVALL
jgi:uncharacterized membrane protein